METSKKDEERYFRVDFMVLIFVATSFLYILGLMVFNVASSAKERDQAREIKLIYLDIEKRYKEGQYTYGEGEFAYPDENMWGGDVRIELDFSHSGKVNIYQYEVPSKNTCTKLVMRLRGSGLSSVSSGGAGFRLKDLSTKEALKICNKDEDVVNLVFSGEVF